MRYQWHPFKDVLELSQNGTKLMKICKIVLSNFPDVLQKSSTNSLNGC